jgi:hypothetical protein
MAKKVSDSGKGKVTEKKIGRDASSGKFIPVKEAQQKPKTTVIETIKTKQLPPKKK